MIIVDATIVNVAVPQTIKDLGITSSDAQWGQEVYTRVFAALLLVWGWLADRYGRRLLFVTGAAAFAAASVLAALTRSGPELIGSALGIAILGTAAVAAMAKQAFSQAGRLTAFTAAAFLTLGLLASLSLGRGNALHQ